MTGGLGVLDKTRNVRRDGQKLTCLLTFILLSACWSQLKKKESKDQLEKQSVGYKELFFSVTFESL